MPARTTITVEDREDTPVSFDYIPAGNGANGEAVFRSSDGTLIGDKLITVSNRLNGGGKRVMRIRLVDPVIVTETINGVSRSVEERAAYATLDLKFDEDSTTQERKNLVGKLADLLDSDQTFMMKVLQDAEHIW